MTITPITVDRDQVVALLIAGEWINVRDVTIEHAEYRSGTLIRYGRGLHVSAVIRNGPHQDERIVAPIATVDAVRLA